MHPNQKAILKYLSTMPSATLVDIYNNQPVRYYCNWQRYMSARMSKLVKLGYVVRLKPCVFSINTQHKAIATSQSTNTNQLNLFK